MLATIIVIAVLVSLYTVAGYYIRPEPDTDNLGWFGGLMNDPFQYKDNINRQLLFLMVLLLPGRALAEGVIAITRAFLRRS